MNTVEHIAGEPEISVIVPIYNVEPYLRQCLDSLCGQTLRNIEIIGVDDGSTDGSGTLLDEYAAKDRRIIAVHQKNAGVSAARNAGMRLAKGEYVAFVDGDDWMELTAYEEILRDMGAKRPDIVIFQNLSVEDGLARKNFRNEMLVKENPPFEELVMRYGAQVTTKLFKRQFIREAGVSFTQGIILGEDTIFCTESFAKAESVMLFGKCYYYYRMFCPSSTMASYFSLRELLKMKTALEQRPFYQKLDGEQRLCIDLSYSSALLYRFGILDKENKTGELSVLEEYLSHLEQTYGRKRLAGSKNYIKLRCAVKEKDFSCDRISFGQKIFSVKNSRDKRYKIVRVLGLELKFERKKCRTEADACQA